MPPFSYANFFRNNTQTALSSDNKRKTHLQTMVWYGMVPGIQETLLKVGWTNAR